jgi:hypothetical protein
MLGGPEPNPAPTGRSALLSVVDEAQARTSTNHRQKAVIMKAHLYQRPGAGAWDDVLRVKVLKVADILPAAYEVAAPNGQDLPAVAGTDPIG